MIWRILGMVMVGQLVWTIFPDFQGCHLTREGEDAQVLAQTLDAYAQSSGVGLPTKWEDLADLLWEHRFRTAEPAKRYAILEQPLPVSRLSRSIPYAAEILVLQRRDVYDAKREGPLRGPGRYVIYRPYGEGGENGRLRSAWLTAKEVRTAFQLAGRELPLPDREPARHDVVGAWVRQILDWAWKSILALWVVVDIVLRLRRWFAESSPPPEGVPVAGNGQQHRLPRQYPW